ncbi:MAG: FAD-dependent oxidoreductase [Planctomycetota bacterium]|nr:FAD-dependent oxidoreductase [Planctomycetota bacterium]
MIGTRTWLALILVTLSTAGAVRAGDATYDVVIYGGTSSAVVAAVQVRRMGRTVAIVCPDTHLGGLSAGGLGWTDSGDKAVIGGVAREFYRRVKAHYDRPEAWTWQSSAQCSRYRPDDDAMWVFEPHVAEAIFERMVEEARIPVFRAHWLERSGRPGANGVEQDGSRLVAITMTNGRTFRGRVFLDATYEGDLMAAAGVSFTVGRESNHTYGETLNGVQKAHARSHQFEGRVDPYVTPGDPASGLLPRIRDGHPGADGEGDHRVQAYNYRVCLTRVPENRVPFKRPDGYDPAQYELLLRTLQAGSRHVFGKFDPVPNAKTDTNNHGSFSTDNIGFNYDYPEASYARRAEILAEHENYQRGYFFFLANDPRVPDDVRTRMAAWGLAKDEFTDNDHWPHQIYVREARRMVSDFVMTESHVRGDRPTPRPVGMGSYNMDSHHVQRYVAHDDEGRAYVRNEGDIQVSPGGAYSIDYGALVPGRTECTNLLVPVCLSSSHIAYGSIRMEPVFMILGQSAATAAVMAIEAEAAVQDVDYAALSARLRADGQVLVKGLATDVMAGRDPVARWAFDSVEEGMVTDRAVGRDDRIEGNYTLTRGAVGSALLFDGFTTVIDRPASDVPRLSGDFSVEAWVAQGAYPWNWCPIITQQGDEKAGYAFCVGPRGQIRLGAAVDGAWRTCTSEDWVLPLRKWTHIAGTFDPDQGITLYADGRDVGTLQVEGQVAFAPDVDLRIGANHALMKPSNIHREHGTVASFWCLDGAIDELKIHDRALSSQEVAEAFASAAPVAECEIQPRRMPSGPKGPGRFGAVYCKLEYYEQWDALWRVDDHPDVLVRFDESPVRVVFWRGSRYSPGWVTNEDQWMADQSVEAWRTGEEDTDGCFEHMQDRLCRYSHVRIIESNDARTVVHWRYAPVSSKNNLWNVDDKTGRACWVDEYYTIYPDAIGVRKPTWKKGTLGGPRQFQESLPFTNPDQYVNDVVEKDFCTLANMQGEQLTLRFIENPARQKEDVPGALTIQRYNFRSDYDPVIIYEPGNRMHYVVDRDIRGYDRPGACNHWPVGQARCDGRTAQAADRPTHFLGFPISYPPIHEKEDRCWWNGIYGMTDLPMKSLITLARSWNHPPRLRLSDEFEYRGYDRGQRAFVLSRSDRSARGVQIEVAAGTENPVFNPAFVLLGWGDADAALTIGGEVIAQGPDFRVGHRHRLEGTDLIVWIRQEATEPFEMTLTPRERRMAAIGNASPLTSSAERPGPAPARPGRSAGRPAPKIPR